MISIPGYQVLSLLYTSSNSVIYRGCRSDTGIPVILKVLNRDYPSPDEIARFKREYKITDKQTSDGVIKVYEIIRHNNTFIMSIEDIGGDSLANILKLCKPGFDEFLKIAVKIAEVIGEIHAGLIIHKDVNPANIIWNRDTGIIKIIDFGISTELTREAPFILSAGSMEGTLPYISPEQTGRMNRDIDYRSDFYSLGATLYEMLCGSLPFPVGDQMELIHCHIARKPEPPEKRNPDLPKAVSDIVMKLLEKNAEDRYQSSQGLSADLRNCLSQFETNGRIDSFTPGMLDYSDRFQIPQKLYGREEEIASLLSAFDRVCNGEKEMVLVAGYSGIGKSSLVREIDKPVVEKRGVFISGKFDQLRRNIPYASIIEAFQKMAEQILVEDDSGIARWKNRLLEYLGPNGQIIINVIPELELIIGRQPPIPELSPKEAVNRFNLVFQNFISAFLSHNHPLVIFLDDMQWADSPSLSLIDVIMKNPSLQYLLIICAYRDNEVDPSHPFMSLINDIRNHSIAVKEISLQNLNISNIGDLISETVYRDIGTVRPLSDLCLQKTGGNPFFLSQFLYAMHRKGLMEYQRSDRQTGWTWDMDKIIKMQMTENVIELMSDKIIELPENSQRVLKLAASIGNRFDLKMLSIVSELKPSETAEALWPPMKAGLIIPGDKSYSLIDESSDIRNPEVHYKFIHDRIQQSAYSLIGEEERPRVHLMLGRLMLEKIIDSERDENIFDIVNHLNLGRGLIDDHAEKKRLAELNLQAGRKARLSAAHEPSLKYLESGISLLPDDAWHTMYSLALELHIDAAEASYLTKHYLKMENNICAVLAGAVNILDKIKAYEIKIKAEVARNMLPEATDTGLEALLLLGLRIRKKPGKPAIILALLRVRMASMGRSIESLAGLPEMTNPKKIALTGILTSIGSATYFSNPALSLIIALENIRLSLRYGNTPLSAFAYVSYAIILSGLSNYEAAYDFGRMALQLIDRFNAVSIKTKTMQIFYCLVSPSKLYLKETLKPTLEGFYIGLETGEVEYAAYIASGYTTHSYFMGIELKEVESRFSKYTEAIRQLQQDSSYYWQKVFYQTVLNLMEVTDNPAVLKGRMYDEDEMLPLHIKANDRLVIFTVYFNKMVMNYYFRDYKAAADNSGLARKYVRNVTGMMAVPVYYFFRSLVMTALMRSADRPVRKRYEKKVRDTQKKMRKWAKHAPLNHLHRWHLIEAELLRTAGRFEEASLHYESAIKHASENEFLQDEALAYELFSGLWSDRKKDEIARLYMTKARHCYKLWGAEAKVRDIEKTYPHYFTSMAENKGFVTAFAGSGSMITGTGSSAALDLASVIKASQSITSEIELGPILKTLIRIAVENAGAQKGFLILEGEKDNSLYIEAEYNSDQTINVLRSIPIMTSGDLSPSIVMYVNKTKKTVVLEHASESGIFQNDPYVARNRSKSILCSPIMNKGDMAGILYLENSLAVNTFNQNRLRVLNILSAQAAISINNARLVAREKNSAVLEKEIEMAKKIQQSLLPKELPGVIGADLAFKYVPMMGIGGDFINIHYREDSGTLGLFICDVSGHGIPAALTATMVSITLDFFWSALFDKPAEVLTGIHTHLSGKLSGNFLTASTAFIDLNTGRLVVSSAGHPPAIILRKNRTIEIIRSRGRLIHGFLKPNYAETVHTLNRGDQVIMYTDGISEAVNPEGFMVGIDDDIFSRWIQVIADGSSSPAELCENLYRAVVSYTGSDNLADDFTVLAVRYTG